MRTDNEKITERWEAITASLASLTGYPPFETFLAAVSDLQRESMLDNCQDTVLRDHAAMAFNSGVVFACERILETAQKN